VNEYPKLNINGKKEIECCLVGYNKFIHYLDEDKETPSMTVVYPSNEEDKKEGKAEQLIFKITPTSGEKNEYK
jgi:hypothetical protein